MHYSQKTPIVFPSFLVSLLRWQLLKGGKLQRRKNKGVKIPRKTTFNLFGTPTSPKFPEDISLLLTMWIV